MKIISYNVNGIRSALKKDWIKWLQFENPDIICLQEIKASPDQLIDLLLLEQLGYKHYWNPAEKKGYSGTAIFTKNKPNHVEYGCGINKYDCEGRIIRADFDSFSIMSAYFPSGSSGEARQRFKFEFLDDFQIYINQLTKVLPNLIISGDYNICHRAIDIHNPKTNANSSGFLPEERKWMDSFIESGFIDSFRKFNQEANQYSWWSFRANARNKNLGWRIDYHMVSNILEPHLKGARILHNVKHSDHCPVLLEIF